MRTTTCQTSELIDMIIDLQERSFDHDFILEHEHIRCLQYNEPILPDDFEILETHHCEGNQQLNSNYILYAIQLRSHAVKGILMSNYKSYKYGMSMRLWQKFSAGIQKGYSKDQFLLRAN